MATCLTSINGAGDQLTELASDVMYPVLINNTVNGLFLLANEMDQSVFFTIRVIGATTNISFTLTLYNAETLATFGTLSVTNSTVNTSFNINTGNYYVCIRSQVLPYNVELTPRFISYNRTATFVSRSYFGVSAETTEIKATRPVGICTRRLVYTIIEGALPPGLTMLENGYISGYLPILDTDDYNIDLPTSDSWYHKIGDDEYVTSWGRAYRFKVHLTLYDDRSKTDIRWFYISIVNDFSKNLALIDEYEMLDDDRDITFEEKVKLTTLTLCPPCGVTDSITPIEEDTAVDAIVPTDYDKANLYSLLEEDPNSAKLYRLIENNMFDEDESIIIDRPTDDQSDDLTDEDELTKNTLIFDADFNNIPHDKKGQSVELIRIPEIEDITFDSETTLEPTFRNIVRSEELTELVETITDINAYGLVEYYIYNIDRDDSFIMQLKDSSMFQSYLKENNISDDYIFDFPLERETYSDVVITYTIVLDEIAKEQYRYIKMTDGEESLIDVSVDEDAADKFTSMYEESYSKLPLSPYSIYGWHASARLVLEGK